MRRELLEELGGVRRVVVVDDRQSFRRCARGLLAEEGFGLPDEAASRLLARDRKLRIVPVSSRERSEEGSLVEASRGLGFIRKAELCGVARKTVLP